MSLFEKYNVPVPRYTSYPTVPYWDNNINEQKWKERVKAAFDASNNSKGISLYMHLPFCESLCTYCACNTRITINHNVEPLYMAALIKEWNMYNAMFRGEAQIKELHLGGGTPTFFSPQNLWALLQEILGSTKKVADADFSFEAHPANTTEEHLRVLHSLSFKRLSLGIQDFDARVQKAIHRFQDINMVGNVVEQARKIGYRSVNFDLIFGLPFQTVESMEETIRQSIKLRPDRIAFYSYAHVPWMKPGQRGYNENDLPVGDEKRRLYERGKELFLEAGYEEVGFDHFALPEDDLAVAQRNKTLHRNFMGYTTQHTELLVALGASAIGDSGDAFSQNEKKIEDYYKAINSGHLPVSKGHLLNDEDLLVRKCIGDIMCKQELVIDDTNKKLAERAIKRMQGILADGLVNITPSAITVNESGRPFLRSIAQCFDERFHAAEQPEKKFSAGV